MSRTQLNPRIVVSIDYGTTYTGLGWMQIDANGRLDWNNLSIFRTWPAINSQKVPSAYSYSPSTSSRPRRQWGHDIDDNSEVMRWTKLQLQPKTPSEEIYYLRDLSNGLQRIRELQTNASAMIDNKIPRHITKSAREVVRDYLDEVAREWRQYMTTGARGGQAIFESVPVDIVITHPAGWKHEALNHIYRAVRGAFAEDLFPTRRYMYLTTEPEACALYTVQNELRRRRNSLIRGDCFVLCDAGGGTVDLVSYRVNNIQPLELIMLGQTAGGPFGATNIDRAFLQLLQTRVKNFDEVVQVSGAGGHFVVREKGRVLLRRFERLKHDFALGWNGGDVATPRGLMLKSQEGDADQEADDTGVINISFEQLEGMFQYSVNGTLDLISRQVLQVEQQPRDDDEDRPNRVTHIFMSGGFSESGYLFERVRMWASNRNIQVSRGEDCWSAVTQGAVLHAVGMGMAPPPMVSPFRRSYGVASMDMFSAWKSGRPSMAATGASRMRWIVRKGDVAIAGDEPIGVHTVSCIFTQSNLNARDSAVITVVATTRSPIPQGLEAMRNTSGTDEIKTFQIPLHEFAPHAGGQFHRPPGEPFRRVDVDVEFIMRDRMTVRLRCRNRVLPHSYSFSREPRPDVPGPSSPGPAPAPATLAGVSTRAASADAPSITVASVASQSPSS